MIFSVANGSFSYDGRHTLWRDICFEVKPGQIVSILGPNGVGKTTLLKCMMGLLKWKTGESRLDGVPLPAIPHRELWQKIAYVPQAKGAPFSMTAREMVLMGRTAHLGAFRQPGKEDAALAEKAMADMGITALADTPCNRMSGGELQMVLIARSLVSNPGILVLDEPESNLDFKNQLVILETMQALAAERGIACIFNTHYPAHALKISSHSLLLDKQGGSRFDETARVITEENMRRAFQVNVHISDIEVQNAHYQSVCALSIAKEEEKSAQQSA